MWHTLSTLSLMLEPVKLGGRHEVKKNKMANNELSSRGKQECSSVRMEKTWCGLWVMLSCVRHYLVKPISNLSYKTYHKGFYKRKNYWVLWYAVKKWGNKKNHGFKFTFL